MPQNARGQAVRPVANATSMARGLCLRHGIGTGSSGFVRVFAGLVALSASPVGWASQVAAELIAAYEKRDVVEMLLHECAGEITINRPFPRRVYGRPPASQVDARTLAHDMERCGFSAEDARAYFERKGAQEKRLGNKPELTIAPKSGSSSASSASSSSPSLQARLRKLEQKELERKYKEERRKQQGRRELARAKSPEQQEAELMAEACTMARGLQRQARDSASSARTVEERNRQRKTAEDMEKDIRKHCK